MTDAVLGAIKGYGWDTIRTFVGSIERSGFVGERVMFVEDIAPDALERLQALGWTLVPVQADRSQNYGTARHVPVHDWLGAHDYRYVIYCDVRDSVFQRDPVPWLEKHLAPAQLIGPSECLLIKDQETNYGWIAQGLGRRAADWLCDYEVLCCGTIVGTGRRVFDVLDEMCVLSRNVSSWGLDQAYFNFRLRVQPLLAIMRIPLMLEGFIATLSWFLSGPERFVGKYTDDAPVFDVQDGLVRAPGSLVPFCIVHQYDRGGGWDRIMQEKYAI